MAQYNSYVEPTEEEQSKLNSLNFTDIVGLCISNWVWFVLCLSITMSAAYLFLRITPPVFTRSTSIMIKEDANAREIDNVFRRYSNSRSSGTSLNNEMIALKKPALMAKVIERLNLNFDYQVKGTLRSTTLYGTSIAYNIKMQTSNEQYFQFRIHEGEDINTVILKFDIPNRYGDKTKEIIAKTGKPVRTPYGIMVIERTHKSFSNASDDITITHMSTADATSRFLAKLNVASASEESTVIDLSLSDVNIERADDVLNTLIAVYNEQWIENRNQVIIATNKFIGERLQSIEKELGDVESEMTNYKVSNHTLDYTSEGSRYMGRSVEYENMGIVYQNELTLTKYYRNFISNVKDNNQTLPLSAGINNPALSEQVNQYNALVLQRSNLISASSESNPLVSDIDKKMAVLQHGLIVTIDNHIGTLNTQVKMLEINDQKNNADIDATPTKQKLFVDIERRRKIKEQLYTYLLQTREQNELNQAFAAYNTRILQPAGGSNYQSYPNDQKIKLIALAIGLGLPLLVIVLREWSNSKVRGRRDVEKLSLPFIGELPLMEFNDVEKLPLKQRITEFFEKLDRSEKAKARRRRINEKRSHINRTVVRAGSRNVINEAFRVLRTNIEFVIGNSKNNVIMATSANPGSGKTFISYNLALCLSLKKKKVVALDLDLRRCSLSAFVDKPELGISDYINGSVKDWHDLLVKSEGSDYLYILPVGTLPPNPAEILSYDKFGEMIEELRQEFDYVFFDCPPVEIVADTSIIAKFADITLFIIRVGLMEQDFLHVIEEYYHDHKFNNMGIILNGTLTANSRYGYKRYGYRYGYGYGYGYGGYGYYGSGYASGYSDGYSHNA